MYPECGLNIICRHEEVSIGDFASCWVDGMW